MVLFLVLFTSALASSCSNDWYFQKGTSYRYDVNSDIDGSLNFNDSHKPATKGLNGQLEVNVFDDCIAEVSYISRLGRSKSEIKAVIEFGSGNVETVNFADEQSVAENNMLKGIVSALQLNQYGIVHKESVHETTSAGSSLSLYECDCGCKECTCDEMCNKVRVTRNAQVAINADSSTLNPLADRLFTKLMLDSFVSVSESTCTYTHKDGVPSLIMCEQSLTGAVSDITTKLMLRATSEESSTSPRVGRSIRGSLIIDSNDEVELLCGDDAMCILERIPAIALSQKESIKNQYLVQREIHNMNVNQLNNLIKAAGKVEFSDMAMDYLFSEVVTCRTKACETVTPHMIKTADIKEAYPTVYRAGQKNPSEELVKMMADDILSASSLEKLDILYFAAKKAPTSSSASVMVKVANQMINSRCNFLSTTPSSLLDYFSVQAHLSENELFTLLNTLNLFDAYSLQGLDISKILACRHAQSEKPITEQSILLLSKILPSDELINAVLPKSYSETASVVLGLWKQQASVRRIRSYFAQMGSIPSHVDILLTAIDTTHAIPDTKLYSKTFDVPLPKSLSQIQHLSGLRIHSEASSTNMAAVQIINRLSNGLGENILEMDLIVNDMVEILDFAVNSGVKFSNDEWKSIINTENAMISLIQAVLNQKFDEIMNASLLPHLQTFCKMGGVSVKLYGVSVELGWAAQLINNVESFVNMITAESKMPSPSELYQIFSQGLEHKYANIMDSRQQALIPMVNGMVATLTQATISTIHYEGTVFPDLMSLGSTGKFAIAPAVSTGTVAEFSVSGLNEIAKTIHVVDSHMSFDLEAAYRVTDNVILAKFNVAPTKTSPAHFHSMHYADLNLYGDSSNYGVGQMSLLGSDIIIATNSYGYEMYLEEPITGAFSISTTPNKKELSAKINSLGTMKISSRGNMHEGAFQFLARDTYSNNYSLNVKSNCVSATDCKISSSASSPITKQMVGEIDFGVFDKSADIKLDIQYGAEKIIAWETKYTFKSNKMLALTTLTSTHPVAFKFGVQCKDTLLTAIVTDDELFGVTDCQIRTGEYDGRMLISSGHDGKLRATINTPFATLSGQAVIGSGTKIQLGAYRYPVGTFASVNQMSNDALAPHEVFELKAVNAGAKTQLRVEVQRKNILSAVAIVNNNFDHSVRIQVPPILLTAGYSLNVGASVETIMYTHFFQWDTRSANQILPRSYFTQNVVNLLSSGKKLQSAVDIKFPTLAHCSNEKADKTGRLVRITVGETASCISLDENRIESIMATPLHNDLPHELVIYRNGDTINISIQNDYFSTKTTASVNIDIPNGKIQLFGQSRGELKQEEYDFGVKINGHTTGSRLNAQFEGKTIDNVFSYKLSGDMEKLLIGNTELIVLSATSPQFKQMNVDRVSLFVQGGKYPVGIQVDNKIKVLAVWPETYLDLMLRNEKIKTSLTIRPNNMAYSHQIVDMDLKFKFDFEHKKLNFLFSSPFVHAEVLPGNYEHSVGVKVHEIGNLSLLVSEDNIKLVDLLLIISSYKGEYLTLNGRSEIRADETGLKKFVINHDITIAEINFTLNAGLNMDPSEATTLGETAEFEVCQIQSKVSYVWVTLPKMGSTGIWTTYDNENSGSGCVNALLKGENNFGQFALDIENSEITSLLVKAELGKLLPLSVVQYKSGESHSLLLSIGDMSALVDINIERRTGSLKVTCQHLEVDFMSTLEVEDTRIILIGDGVVARVPTNMKTTLTLDLGHVGLQTDITGVVNIHQIAEVIWNGEYKIVAEFESSLAVLNFATIYDESNTAVKTTFDFDIQDNTMMFNGLLNIKKQELHVKSSGLICSNEFDIASDTIIARKISDKTLIRYNNVAIKQNLFIDLDTADFNYENDSPIGSIEASKKSADGQFAVDVEISNVPIVFVGQTSKNNMVNMIKLEAINISLLKLTSDFTQSKHMLELYGAKFRLNIDENNFSMKTEIDNVNLVGSGSVVSKLNHKSKWDVIVTDKKSYFSTAQKHIVIEHEFVENRGLLKIETPEVTLHSSAEYKNSMLSGAFSVKTPSIKVSISEFNAGISKGRYVFTCVSTETESKIEVDPKAKSLKINIDQSISEILAKVDLYITISDGIAYIAEIKPYQKWLLKSSLNKQGLHLKIVDEGRQTRAFELLAAEGKELDIKTQWDAIFKIESTIKELSKILKGHITDIVFDISSVSDQVALKVSQPQSFLIDFSMNPDYSGKAIISITPVGFDSTTTWNKNMASLVATSSKRSISLDVNWQTISTQLVVDELASVSFSIPDALFKCEIEYSGHHELFVKWDASTVMAFVSLEEIVTSKTSVDYINMLVKSEGKFLHGSYFIDIKKSSLNGKVTQNDRSMSLDVDWQDITLQFVIEHLVSVSFSIPDALFKSEIEYLGHHDLFVKWDASTVMAVLNLDDFATSKTSVNYLNLAIKSEAKFPRGGYSIDITQSSVNGKVTLDVIDYEIVLNMEKGKMLLPNIVEATYTFEEGIIKSKIVCDLFKMKMSFSAEDYACNLQLASGDIIFKLLSDGEKMKKLRMLASKGSVSLLMLDISADKNYNFDLTVGDSAKVNFRIGTKTLAGMVQIADLIITINNLDLDSSMKLDADVVYGVFDGQITAQINDRQIKAKLTSKKFGLVVDTKNQFSTGPLTLKSLLEIEMYGQQCEAKFSYKSGATKAALSIATAIIKGDLQLEADGLAVNTFAIDNVMFNSLDIFVRGGFSYKNNVLTVKQTVIKQIKSDSILFGISNPGITVNFNAGITPVKDLRVIAGPYQFVFQYTDVSDFALTQLEPSKYVGVNAKDGEYTVKIGGNVVSGQAKGNKKLLKMEILSADFDVATDGMEYRLTANVPNTLQCTIMGRSDQMIKGFLKMPDLTAKFDLTEDLVGNTASIVYKYAKVLTFKSKNKQELVISMTGLGNSIKYQQSRDMANLIVASNGYSLMSSIDYSKSRIDSAIRRGEQTIANVLLVTSGRQLIFKIQGEEGELMVTSIPSDKRLKFGVIFVDSFSAEGDFSATQFHTLNIISPSGKLECTNTKCSLKSTELNLNSEIIFGKEFSFYFGGDNPHVTLIDIQLSASTSNVELIFYKMIALKITSSDNMIRAAGQLGKTNFKLSSKMDEYLNVAARGPSVEFSLHAAPEIAEWNMSKPLTNKIIYQDQEVVILALDRKFTIRNENGFLNLTKQLA